MFQKKFMHTKLIIPGLYGSQFIFQYSAFLPEICDRPVKSFFGYGVI